ncbi:DUF5606 domain-containing protein [Mangrovivirga sp. M17]|uniref:DUF5606 domain-containing protein n=1 Tax=Mangrovivirga halotolerans TaxID=2993936 RepID=A0ABT3RNC0_9BACT|nr:DUF5606 domain-containing protein [Mangrovivirga halotolerans]MCX2742843.1 DUF5606 domain-containing protein [Mangrovivirga halotolerans]
MGYTNIAAVAGKGGLFNIVKPTRAGVILETIDDQKKKLVVGGNARVSVLSDISIYTVDAEGSVPVADVFKKIKDEFDDDPGVNSTSDDDELHAFLKHLVPDYDEERVYASDIKKLVSWYNILYKYEKDLLSKGSEDGEEENENK